MVPNLTFSDTVDLKIRQRALSFCSVEKSGLSKFNFFRMSVTESKSLSSVVELKIKINILIGSTAGANCHRMAVQPRLDSNIESKSSN